MSNNDKLENHSKNKLIRKSRMSIEKIMEIQSLPKEVVEKLIQAKGSLRKYKKGILLIVKKAK